MLQRSLCRASTHRGRSRSGFNQTSWCIAITRVPGCLPFFFGRIADSTIGKDMIAILTFWNNYNSFGFFFPHNARKQHMINKMEISLWKAQVRMIKISRMALSQSDHILWSYYSEWSHTLVLLFRVITYFGLIIQSDHILWSYYSCLTYGR